MTTPNDTKSVDLAQHLELAAFHLYEACRSWSKVVLPSFADEDVQDMRRDAKYRAMAAHRRGIKSCRGIARERIAAVLAVADGLIDENRDKALHTCPAHLRSDRRCNRLRRRSILGAQCATAQNALQTTAIDPPGEMKQDRICYRFYEPRQ